LTGEEKQEVIKVPVKKMKPVPKVKAVAPKPVVKKIDKVIEETEEEDTPEAEHEKKKMTYLEDLESNLKEAFARIHKQKSDMKVKKA
jgi:hypothetical protein